MGAQQDFDALVSQLKTKLEGDQTLRKALKWPASAVTAKNAFFCLRAALIVAQQRFPGFAPTTDDEDILDAASAATIAVATPSKSVMMDLTLRAGEKPLTMVLPVPWQPATLPILQRATEVQVEEACRAAGVSAKERRRISDRIRKAFQSAHAAMRKSAHRSRGRFIGAALDRLLRREYPTIKMADRTAAVQRMLVIGGVQRAGRDGDVVERGAQQLKRLRRRLRGS